MPRETVGTDTGCALVFPPAHREEAIEMVRDTLEHKQNTGFGFLSGPRRGN